MAIAANNVCTGTTLNSKRRERIVIEPICQWTAHRIQGNGTPECNYAYKRNGSRADASTDKNNAKQESITGNNVIETKCYWAYERLQWHNMSGRNLNYITNRYFDHMRTNFASEHMTAEFNFLYSELAIYYSWNGKVLVRIRK